MGLGWDNVIFRGSIFFVPFLVSSLHIHSLGGSHLLENKDPVFLVDLLCQIYRPTSVSTAQTPVCRSNVVPGSLTHKVPLHSWAMVTATALHRVHSALNILT